MLLRKQLLLLMLLLLVLVFLLKKTGNRNEPISGGDGARKYTEPRMHDCQAIEFGFLSGVREAIQPPFPFPA